MKIEIPISRLAVQCWYLPHAGVVGRHCLRRRVSDVTREIRSTQKKLDLASSLGAARNEDGVDCEFKLRSMNNDRLEIRADLCLRDDWGQHWRHTWRGDGDAITAERRHGFVRLCTNWRTTQTMKNYPLHVHVWRRIFRTLHKQTMNVDTYVNLP